jgi:hypothetical protein
MIKPAITFLLAALLCQFANAQLNQGWCGAEVPAEFRQQYFSKDRSDYINFSGSRGTVRYVPVVYHIVQKTDGTLGVNLRDVLNTHCELNEHYLHSDIQFFIAEMDTIKSNTLWAMSTNGTTTNYNTGYQAFNTYNVDDVCNIYITGQLPGLCGFATFPGSAPNGGGIFMNKECTGAGTKTLPHEMGHYLGLLHTFDSGSGIEFVNGTNCATAGDGFCDTPADFLNERVPCPYTGNETDPNGDLYNTVIDESLFMSYFSDNCVYRFSQMEENEMNSVLTNQRPGLLNQAVPDLSAPDTIEVISPAAGDSSLMANGTIFSWSRVPGAVYYNWVLQSGNVLIADTVTTDTFLLIGNLLVDQEYKFKVRALSLGNTCGVFNSFTSFKTSKIKAAFVVTAPTCFGENNGLINMTPLGGTAPYTYLWSNGSTAQNPFPLYAGTYFVTVTDATGETAVTQVSVGDGLIINLSISKVQNNLLSQVSGGLPPYVFMWSNGATTAAANNVTPGTYTLTVSDANGCSRVVSYTVNAVGLEDVENNIEMKVFPNPIQGNGNITLQLTLPQGQEGEITIMDIRGAVLQKQNTKLEQGLNTIKLSAAGLAGGNYLVRYNSPDADKTMRITILR